MQKLQFFQQNPKMAENAFASDPRMIDVLGALMGIGPEPSEEDALEAIVLARDYGMPTLLKPAFHLLLQHLRPSSVPSARASPGGPTRRSPTRTSRCSHSFAPTSMRKASLTR